jgi:hypothetical protein
MIYYLVRIYTSNMKHFTAFYFNHHNNISSACSISADNRLDAIKLFEELYPHCMLVGLREIMEKE